MKHSLISLLLLLAGIYGHAQVDLQTYPLSYLNLGFPVSAEWAASKQIGLEGMVSPKFSTDIINDGFQYFQRGVTSSLAAHYYPLAKKGIDNFHFSFYARYRYRFFDSPTLDEEVAYHRGSIGFMGGYKFLIKNRFILSSSLSAGRAFVSEVSDNDFGRYLRGQGTFTSFDILIRIGLGVRIGNSIEEEEDRF
ncbi:MAG: hypothetical protein AAFY71_03305 [Bacteroidota bacterium]